MRTSQNTESHSACLTKLHFSWRAKELPIFSNLFKARAIHSPRALKPRVPKGRRIYAIGDVHGRIDILTKLLGRIFADIKNSAGIRPSIIFLGDYVDRGPDAAAVIEELCRLRQNCESVFLKGNHEAMLLDFLRDSNTLLPWAAAGGLPTLCSYGLNPPLRPTPEEAHELREAFIRSLPDEHVTFLRTLSLYYQAEDYYFVHAGVRPETPLAEQVEADLLWIRAEFLQHRGHFEKRIVHGHTPVKAPDILPNRINIDTGAFATGQLTCLVLEGDSVGFL